MCKFGVAVEFCASEEASNPRKRKEKEWCNCGAKTPCKSQKSQYCKCGKMSKIDAGNPNDNSIDQNS